MLENGDEVPADGILFRDRNLIIDESNFTGEPFTKKRTESDGKRKKALIQRTFCCEARP